ncbi:hypothetical protein JB92DRAFT_2837764 [Gautieria morchelliformis]|nr:hypothetical protein JB92DRAFT_2837764 [Gautieria morchelliformis]
MSSLPAHCSIFLPFCSALPRPFCVIVFPRFMGMSTVEASIESIDTFTVNMAMIKLEPRRPALPPAATWYEDNRDGERFPSRAQSPLRVIVPKSPSPKAPPDNTSFYPAKHLVDEFELMRKHNPRAIAQRGSELSPGSVGLNSLPDSTRNLPSRDPLLR